MKLGWPKRRHDPKAQEVAEQAERSKATLDRVDKVLDRASAIIDDYNTAEKVRLARRET